MARRSRSPAATATTPPRAADFDSHPSDMSLIESHLRPRAAACGARAAAAFVHEADLYAAAPAELAQAYAPAVAQDGERAWYFLTRLRPKSGRGRRVARTAGDGWWHGEARQRPVVDGLAGRRQVGWRQSFSFMREERGARVRTGWIMAELRLYDPEHGERDEEVPVLCKVYRSPRHPILPERSDTEPAAAVAAPRRNGGDASTSATTTARQSKADGEISGAPTAPEGSKGEANDKESSAATTVAPGQAVSGAATAAAPGRTESEKAAAGDEDSAETSAAAPARKRKAADDESSGAARKRHAADDGQISDAARQLDGNGATKLHCPRCGFHLGTVQAGVATADSESETGVLQVGDGAPQQGGQTRDSSVRGHTFYHFL